MTKKQKTENNKQIKLYTKTGDGGESGLGSGQRLPKSDPVFEVLGTIDELNSWLGVCVVQAKKITNHKLQITNKSKTSNSKFETKQTVQELQRVQEMLLKCGASVGANKDFKKEIEQEVTWLEGRIDHYQSQFGDDWFKRFLLPGGTELAARIDVARSVCRRAERIFVSDSRQPTADSNKSIGQYLNRLSDYLFALRCWVNEQAGYDEQEFES